MIFYPQPQLAIKAEDRPDEIMAAPDENGWSNIDLPHGADASSSFMQGPAGGQLASQASTQARLQVSRLAQDAMYAPFPPPPLSHPPESYEPRRLGLSLLGLRA
jgi:hypothetical protein